MKATRKHRLNHIAIVPPMISRGREYIGTEAAVVGLLLAAFRYEEYKGTATQSNGDREADQDNDAKPIQVSVLTRLCRDGCESVGG